MATFLKNYPIKYAPVESRPPVQKKTFLDDRLQDLIKTNAITAPTMSKVSADITAPYSPVLERKGDLGNLRKKLLSGMTAQDFVNWGDYDKDEASLQKLGVLKNTERLFFNQSPIKPDTVVKIEQLPRLTTPQEQSGSLIADIANIPFIPASAGEAIKSGMGKSYSGVSIPDLATLGLLAYGGVEVAKGTWNTLVETGLVKKINQIAAQNKILITPQEKNALVNVIMKGFTAETKTGTTTFQPDKWKLTKTAIESLFKKAPSGAFQTTPQAEKAADEAATALIKQYTPQLTKFTQTNTGVPGMTMSQSEIIRTIQGVVPQTAQAVQAGRMKLKPEVPPQVTNVPEKVTPQTVSPEQTLIEPAPQAVESKSTGIEAPKSTETPATITPGAVTAPPITTPPIQPPIQPPITYSSPEPTPQPKGGIKFAPLQDTQTAIDIATKPDVYRSIANLPGLKEIMKSVNPSAVAGTPAEKAIIARAVLRDEAGQKSQGVISYLNQLGSQQKVFGKLDNKGLIQSGDLKGKSVNDIRTYPNKYKLSTSQKQWIERAEEIEQAKLQYLRENGIDIRELSFAEGGQYAGRRVYAMMSSDGELLDTALVSAGPSRVGGKLGAEKHRIFATAEEAIKAGYRYLPDDEALALNVRAAYNKVADKKMAEWLLSKIPWRTTGAPEELILAAEGARMRLYRSKQLLAALNRANRGEKLPTQTINSIARVYPNEAKDLEQLVNLKQSGKAITKPVKALRDKAKALIDSNTNDYNAAVNARARARETAMSPHYGEAMVMHPSFQGKIFTGEEAKKTADTLRNALEPRLNKLLEGANKFNAFVRYFKLAGDMSPFGIQLLYLAGQNPVTYGKAGVAFMRVLFDSKFHATFISNNKGVIDRHPNLIMSSQGTEFTEALARGGLLRSGVMKMGGVVLEPFQRGFEVALDVAGIEMAKSLEHLAKTPQQVADLDQFINEFRGMTSSARLGVTPNWRAVETMTLLAPRYNRAIAGLLSDTVRGGLRGRLARNGLARGIIALVAMFIVAGFAMGKDWDEIKDTLDPRSSKFLTYDIGGVNIGPGSKVRSVIRVVAESAENPDDLLQLSMENNPALRFVRGNLSPMLGQSIDLIKGKNYIGDPTRDSWLTFARENMLVQFLPIWVENLAMEGGNPSQRMIRGAGEFFGGRAYPETAWDEVSRLRDRYAAEDFGKKYEELNNSDKDSLKSNHKDLVEMETKAENESSVKGSDIERFYFLEKQRLTEVRNNALEKSAQA